MESILSSPVPSPSSRKGGLSRVMLSCRKVQSYSRARRAADSIFSLKRRALRLTGDEMGCSLITPLLPQIVSGQYGDGHTEDHEGAHFSRCGEESAVSEMMSACVRVLQLSISGLGCIETLFHSPELHYKSHLASTFYTR